MKGIKYFSAKLECENTNIDIDLVFLSDQVPNVIETKNVNISCLRHLKYPTKEEIQTWVKKPQI